MREVEVLRETHKNEESKIQKAITKRIKSSILLEHGEIGVTDLRVRGAEVSHSNSIPGATYYEGCNFHIFWVVSEAFAMR